MTIKSVAESADWDSPEWIEADTASDTSADLGRLYAVEYGYFRASEANRLSLALAAAFRIGYLAGKESGQ